MGTDPANGEETVGGYLPPPPAAYLAQAGVYLLGLQVDCIISVEARLLWGPAHQTELVSPNRFLQTVVKLSPHSEYTARNKT